MYNICFTERETKILIFMLVAVYIEYLPLIELDNCAGVPVGVMITVQVHNYSCLNEQCSKARVNINYLNELQGCMTQCPAVFCRIRSLTNAFLLPNNFIANRLSVGWNHDCSWFFKKFEDIFSVKVDIFGNGSSFGVPYKETSSKWTYMRSR